PSACPSPSRAGRKVAVSFRRHLPVPSGAPPPGRMQKDATGMTVLVMDRRHPLRDATEPMIRETYRTRYGATLGPLPDLLAAFLSPDGLPAAACSIRFAEHGFFSAA